MDSAHSYTPENIPSYSTPPSPQKIFSKYKAQIFGTFFVLAALAVAVTSQSLSPSRQTVKVSADASIVPLSEVQNYTGTTILYSNPSQLTISKLNPNGGVYSLQYIPDSTTKPAPFPCIPGPNCEPDRFEVRYSGTSDKIFGLGVVPFKTNKAELDDFLDTSFGFGHELNNRISNGTTLPLEIWSGDAVRGRTPILTIPQKSMIIFYPQPDVKMVRLTRNVNIDPKYTSGCPIGSTCMIFKKHNTYPEGATAPLIIIKGSSMADAYKKYFEYITSVGNIYKKPQFATFGNNWETFQELGCQPTSGTIVDNTDSIVNRFLQRNIKLSTLTMGSGWWTGIKTGASVGCDLGGNESMLTPATDAFGQNTDRFPKGLDDVFTKLRAVGTVPILGMRPQIQPGDLNNSNLGVIAAKFGLPATSVFLTPPQNPSTPGIYYSGTTFTNSTTGQLMQKYHFQLNVTNQAVMDKWAQLLRGAYGSFGGFKYDDMRNSDNFGYISYLAAHPNPANAPTNFDTTRTRNDKDNFFNLPFKTFYNQYGQNFLVFSPSNWFSQNDANYTLCAASNYGTNFPAPPNIINVGLFKYCVDAAINTVMSGIPLLTNWGIIPRYVNGAVGNYYTAADKADYIRQHQLAVWFPVTMYSPGFWRLRQGTDGADVGPDTVLQNIAVWNLGLRQRLQRYAFDYASLGYDEKTTYLLRPLMFDYPNDPKVYDQYTELVETATSRPPKDEFMFGKALLVRPIFSTDQTTVNIYFPAGKWLPFISNPATKGRVFSQGNVDYPYVALTDTTGNLDYPVFLKKGEILVIGDGNLTSNTMWAYVYLDPGETSNPYISYDKNGVQKFQLTAAANAAGTSVTITAKRLNGGDSMSFVGVKEPSGKGFYVVNVTSAIN